MILHVLSKLFAHLISFDTVIVFLTWLSALAGAAITFVVRRGDGHPQSVRGFLSFLVPPPVWQHRSPRLDVLYYAAQHLMLPVMAVPFLLGNAVVSVWIYHDLAQLFGAHAQVPPSTALWVVLLAVSLVAIDFSTFFIHYLEHKVGPLWDIHKTHHSVEFLIPLSNRRIHPFEQVIDISGNAVFLGVITGVLCYALSLPIYDRTVVGLDVYFLANLLSFYHLRHSHIDMSYGRLEKWLMSPAQHQLHHSQEPEHWDRNFGLNLAIWDRLFGTLLYSQRRGTFRLGLPTAEGVGYDSLIGLYVTPIRNTARRLASVVPILAPALRDRRPSLSGPASTPVVAE